MGLLIMYSFLILLCLGLFIYSKIDDKKRQKG